MPPLVELLLERLHLLFDLGGLVSRLREPNELCDQDGRGQPDGSHATLLSNSLIKCSRTGLFGKG